MANQQKMIKLFSSELLKRNDENIVERKEELDPRREDRMMIGEKQECRKIFIDESKKTNFMWQCLCKDQ
jgi:hypothetical protein